MVKRDESGHTVHYYRAEISKIMIRLSSLDYKTIKYVEGALSDEDFEDVREEKANLRAKIADLEEKIAELEEKS